nr:hypothetical protein CFP56_61057 [Quercus suber]
MAMNKELSRVHANLEEELQRLEGTSEKLQVVESTKSALDSEDANDSDDVADLEEFQLLGAMEAGVQMIETEEELGKNKLAEINPGLLAFFNLLD